MKADKREMMAKMDSNLEEMKADDQDGNQARKDRCQSGRGEGYNKKRPRRND
jgi:hypothetical protein